MLTTAVEPTNQFQASCDDAVFTSATSTGPVGTHCDDQGAASTPVDEPLPSHGVIAGNDAEHVNSLTETN